MAGATEIATTAKGSTTSLFLLYLCSFIFPFFHSST